MNRKNHTRRNLLAGLAVAVAVAGVAPRRRGASATQDRVCNVTTSLASTVNDPVAGDEQFFKLPVGPSTSCSCSTRRGRWRPCPSAAT